MHPDYTSDTPGTCPRCGMTLVRTAPFDVRDYRVEFRTEPAAVKPSQKIKMFFKFLKPDSADVVKTFIQVHTKDFHLFVISQNMDFFEHIHPEMLPDGTWTIETTLPKAGYYKVLCDFFPAGGSSQFLAIPLVTAGYAADLAADSAHLEPDKVPKETDGALTATMAYDPDPCVAGMYCHLNITVSDTNTGIEVADLQTYLGAFGHMLIMSEDMEEYVHSHPLEVTNLSAVLDGDPPEFLIPPDADLEKIRGGPIVTFEGLMPKPGLFRAWAQFRRNDKVHTVAFTFNVIAPDSTP
jgi:hypothetical protein